MPQPRLKLADDTTRKPARRTTFNKAALERVPTPTDRETVIHDDRAPGLTFRVRPSGARAFYLYRKHRGRPLRLKLGDFPTMTIEQARKAATAAVNDLNAGKDIAGKRRDERGEPTLRRLWETYKAEHLEPRCSPRTIRAESGLFRKHLNPLASRRLSDITPANVKARHSAIGKVSRTSANRSIQLLRRLFNYAKRHHGYKGDVPTAAVELYREQSRERFLSADELPRFLKACDAEGQPWADFFRMALATGARRSNVQAMAWADLDLPGRKWTIPAEQSKNGRAMAVPLTAAAVEILKRRKAEQADNPGAYVFPPLRDKGGTKHISQPARPFARICERAGIEGLTIHDLRRTAGAFLAASGANMPTIGKALGHADLRATQIYARLDLDPVRVAMDAAADAMNKAGVADKPKTTKARKGGKAGKR